MRSPVIAGSGARIRPLAFGRAFPKVPTLPSGQDYSQSAYARFREGSFPRQLQAPTLVPGTTLPKVPRMEVPSPGATPATVHR